MKGISLITKIAVCFCGILLIISAFVCPDAFAQQAKPVPIPAIQPPAWYQTLPSGQRFAMVMDGQAVLDRETGLVWEKSPSMDTTNWLGAQSYCIYLTTGGRLGWRLPTIQELASLVDLSVSAPALPSGHPFTNVQADNLTDNYWSATTIALVTTYAWGVNFYLGIVADFNGPGDLSKDGHNYVWCVRGGQGLDPQ